MFVEQGTVINYQKGKATVQCYAKSSCGSCVARNECGVKSLSALNGEKSAPQIEVKVNEVLEQGDVIEIGLAERTLLSSVFWLYCIPLLTVILSAVGLSQFFANELIVALGIVICTAVSFIVVKKVLEKKQHLQPKAIYLGKVS